MGNENINTSAYLGNLKKNLERKAVNLNLDKGGDESRFNLVRSCLVSLDIIHDKFVRHLAGYDDNPFWSSFLQDYEVDFDFEEEFEENCFLIMAIIEILIKEVRVVGIESTAMRDIEKEFVESKVLFGDDYKKKYNRCLSRYQDIDRFSILYWRAFNDFKKGNNKSIESEFRKIKDDVDELENDLSESKSSLNDEVSGIKSVLEGMERRTGFLSLYSGFDKYGTQIKRKLTWLRVEKIIWVVFISVSIGLGFYFKLDSDVDWVAIIPLAGLVLLFSTLLRVNLKKTDQYEQIMSKVEHKLAVSTFYINELNSAENASKDDMNKEYYRFIFSDIKTTEWSTPDMVGDIANVLKSYNKK